MEQLGQYRTHGQRELERDLAVAMGQLFELKRSQTSQFASAGRLHGRAAR